MKHLVLSIAAFLFFFCYAFAAHIIGGEMRYAYVGPGTAPNTKVYQITLILFRGDDPNGAPLAGSYVIGIFNNDNNQKLPGNAANNNWLISQNSISPVPIVFPTCIQNAPVLNYTYGIYTMTVELPDNQNGYTATYQTCCRINGLANMTNSTGSTYTCSIPGSILGSETDSSPQFGTPVNVVCRNSPFTLNFSAVDPDPRDSLVYSLCAANSGGAATDASFNNPAAPPYGFASYFANFSGANPFGTGATINPQTGIISGTAPELGSYVVTVCITVFRDNVIIATHKKDLIVRVNDCIITTARPIPSFVTCDGFNIQFSHTSIGANSVFWDFGDPTTLADTSISDNPSWNFPDTGVYRVKFVINRGTSCSDSAYSNIGIYPGFFPGFTITGSCFQNPFLFRDTTNTQFGVVDSWKWDFGDLSTIADTSRIQNPQWTYPNPGPRTARLIVTNSKGCVDTATVDFTVLDKPPLTLAFRDTLICITDAVTLNATGSGTFSWTPLTNITGANTSSPTVTPTTDTWYVVNINDNGCVNRDSVRVRVISVVSLTAMADTTICLTDNVQLGAVTNGLQFQWTPAATLNNPSILNPIATPTAVTTTYQIRAIVGSCSSTDDVVVTTVPYPIANAGISPTICYNTSAQLSASIVGSSFNWSPVSYLNDPAILNPISSPPRTTSYVLSAFDTLGCPKPGRDTVIVTVLPRVRAYAGPDTTVVVGQPLQFNATGGVSYLWSPPTGLSAIDINDPVGMYDAETDSVRYKLIVRDRAGCADSTTVLVKVFKTNPYVFVPTAFTPNNDGLNDVIRPFAVGIQRINYFTVYNRWGQRVFTTNANMQGWDGRINGQLQASGVFVWVVSAVDYIGRPLILKGTVALIR
jgi:gliding motility-associated-like protein